MKSRNEWTLAMLCLIQLSIGGCRKGMYDQEKLKASDPSAPAAEERPLAFDARTASPQGKQAVSQGSSSWALDAALIERGQERFRIFCRPCHGELGYGDGIIVQRGFGAPPSFHEERLRSVPDDYIVSVMSTGLLKMPAFSSRIARKDRWAIAQYIRVLQWKEKESQKDEGGRPQ